MYNENTIISYNKMRSGIGKYSLDLILKFIRKQEEKIAAALLLTLY